MEHVLVGLASVLVLGIVAQVVAWRLRIPSILLLLMFGFIAGPVTGFLDPDHTFGQFLLPLVSVSVGIILFEGGLTLKLVELRRIGEVVRNLNSISVVVTWLIVTLAAHYILSFSWPLALLMGAILTVTGPTVIGPLLRHVGNVGHAGVILKWEGILIDPIGATLALLVFEAILPSGSAASPALGLTAATVGFLKTAVVGGGIGLLGALLVIYPLKRYWIPDFLQNPVTLMVVVAAFVAANELQHEAGLLATTVMGIALANAKEVDARHILEFKENLTILLVSSLFIVLSARLDLAVLNEINSRSILFLLFLILIARPLSVAVATWGSDLDWQERFFVAWMAPRGIVAAAVASIFGLELAEAGFAEAARLAPLVFLTIVGTVMVYGLTALPVSRWLGLHKRRPDGLLIAGAHEWAREIGHTLHELGQQVVLVDNNRDHITQAQLAGLTTLYGNILSEYTEDRVELQGLGRFLALTANDEINSLAAINYADIFGRDQVYQLAPHRQNGQREGEPTVPSPLRGRTLFGREVTAEYLNERFGAGATVKATNITPKFTYQDFQEYYDGKAVPLFIQGSGGLLNVVTAKEPIAPQPGDILISIVDAKDSPQEAIARERAESTEMQLP